jgi:hypothetical protein
VALVFNLPAALQRAIPEYTTALQQRVGGGDEVRRQLNLGAFGQRAGHRVVTLRRRRDRTRKLQHRTGNQGITTWLNTPGGAPVDLKSLHGKVVLIDFWAYSRTN